MNAVLSLFIVIALLPVASAQDATITRGILQRATSKLFNRE